MNREEIVIKTQEVFRTVFNKENLEIFDEMNASDVDNWDSLSHMLLISEIEEAFEVRFKLRELNKMKNVGDLIELLLSKQA